MTKRNYEQKLDATIRLHSAVWFSILEALGPDTARRAAANMYDLGLLYELHAQPKRAIEEYRRAATDKFLDANARIKTLEP